MTAHPDHRPSSPGLLLTSASAGMFVFGIVMATLGAILPSLFDKIGFGEGAAGNLFLTMNFAMLVTTLFFGPLVDRFGFKVLLAVSAVLVAGSFALLAYAPTYGAVLGAAVVLGLGGGSLNGGTNALASDIYSDERRGSALNVLGIFFGFGALTIPFLTGFLLAHLGLRKILFAAVALSLVPFLLYIAIRFPRAKQAQGFPIKEAARVVRSPLVWLCGFLLFFESGNEFLVGGWISTHLQRTFGVVPATAAFVLAGYWAAVMAGRLLSARLVRRVPKATLIGSSAALALAAAVILALSPSGALAAAGAVLIGLGFAAIYPTTLAIVGESFAALSGTAFSLVIAVGLVGGMLAPWLAGQIAQASSLRHGLLLAVFDCAMIIVLAFVIARVRSANKKTAAA